MLKSKKEKIPPELVWQLLAEKDDATEYNDTNMTAVVRRGHFEM